MSTDNTDTVNFSVDSFQLMQKWFDACYKGTKRDSLLKFNEWLKIWAKGEEYAMSQMNDREKKIWNDIRGLQVCVIVHPELEGEAQPHTLKRDPFSTVYGSPNSGKIHKVCYPMGYGGDKILEKIPKIMEKDNEGCKLCKRPIGGKKSEENPKHASEKWSQGKWVFDEKKSLEHWNDAKVDALGIPRWKSNNQIPFDDMLEDWASLGLPFNLELSKKTRAEEVAKELEAYRKTKHTLSEETMAEMRSEYGSGDVVVDIISGEKYKINPTENEGHLSDMLYEPIQKYVVAYQEKKYSEIQEAIKEIEKIAGVSKILPAYPTETEVRCPLLLAKIASCTAQQLKAGRLPYHPAGLCRKMMSPHIKKWCPEVSGGTDVIAEGALLSKDEIRNALATRRITNRRIKDILIKLLRGDDVSRTEWIDAIDAVKSLNTPKSNPWYDNVIGKDFNILSGPKMKNIFGATRVRKRYENVHKDNSGNFGFTIVMPGEIWFTLDGDYDTQNKIKKISLTTFSGSENEQQRKMISDMQSKLPLLFDPFWDGVELSPTTKVRDVDETRIITVNDVVDSLEDIEKDWYNKYNPKNEIQKDEALKVIVNTVEGDETQLSELLREYAKAKGWLEGWDVSENPRIEEKEPGHFDILCEYCGEPMILISSEFGYDCKNRCAQKRGEMTSQEIFKMISPMFQLKENLSTDTYLTQKSGKLIISGNTYDYRDIIKQNGFKWDGKVWSKQTDRPQITIDKLKMWFDIDSAYQNNEWNLYRKNEFGKWIVEIKVTYPIPKTLERHILDSEEDADMMVERLKNQTAQIRYQQVFKTKGE